MKQPISNYVALDLETTGLDAKKHKIIEIGAVKVRDNEVVETYRTFINPGWQLEERITQITGITNEDLLLAPAIQEKIEEFLEFAGDDVLLGHSLLFDYSFVKRAAVNKGLSFEKEGIDTLTISRKYLNDLPSRNLNALCRHYGLSHNPHRALEDAKATHLLYQKLVAEFFSKERENDFAPQELIYRVKKEGPITAAQKKRLLALLSMHKIKPEYDVERLTKNEASRIMDKIVLEHGRR